MTGSTTSGTGLDARKSATVSMIARENSIPVLAASTPMSSKRASSCARMKSGGTSWTAVTARVFWAVSATIAVVPWQPAAANAFRSAWIPAPPPESEVAIVRQRGTATSTANVPGRTDHGDHPAASLPPGPGLRSAHGRHALRRDRRLVRLDVPPVPEPGRGRRARALPRPGRRPVPRRRLRHRRRRAGALRARLVGGGYRRLGAPARGRPRTRPRGGVRLRGGNAVRRRLVRRGHLDLDAYGR